MSTEADRKALEAFVVENADLEQLEALMSRFNIFEAIRAERKEQTHSDFLAYLLNPQQSHGLGVSFVKGLLQRCVAAATETLTPISAIDLDTWDLTQLEVFRERQHMDILLKDEVNRFVVIIENKIDTGEHSAQLERYWMTAQEQFAGWKMLGFYLTPDGDPPSSQNFLPIGYYSMLELLEMLLESRTSTIGPDVRTLIAHYTQMLRRHIVSESEVGELCRRIYRKHKQAIDLIIDNLPDRQATIRELLEDMVKKTPKLVLDHCSKGYVRFAVQDWESQKLRTGQGWTPTGRILLFEFQNGKESLELKLIIGPGPQEVRERILLFAVANQPPFKVASKVLNRQWNSIFSRSFMPSRSYSEAVDEVLKTRIQGHWEDFIKTDLPKLSRLVGAQSWLHE